MSQTSRHLHRNTCAFLLRKTQKHLKVPRGASFHTFSTKQLYKTLTCNLPHTSTDSVNTLQFQYEYLMLESQVIQKHHVGFKVPFGAAIVFVNRRQMIHFSVRVMLTSPAFEFEQNARSRLRGARGGIVNAQPLPSVPHERCIVQMKVIHNLDTVDHLCHMTSACLSRLC